MDELVCSLGLCRLFGEFVLGDVFCGIARPVGEAMDVVRLCEMVVDRRQLCVSDHVLCVDVFVQHGMYMYVCVGVLLCVRIVFEQCEERKKDRMRN